MSERFAPLAPAHQPLLFVAAAFSLGISGEHAFNFSPQVLLGGAIGFFVLSLVGYTVGRRWHHGDAAYITTTVLLTGFAVAGGLWLAIERRDVAPTRIRQLIQSGVIVPTEPVEVIGQLARPPESAPQRVYLDLAVERIRTFKRIHPASGQVRLMLVLNDDLMQQIYEQLNLNYGAQIRVLTYLRRAARYRNPGSPDYTEFLDERGYDAAGVVKSPRLITVLARHRGNLLLARVYEGRRRAEAALDRLFSGQTAAILKALLLGNQHFLSRETAERFRAGGTFHILVISGMHVGFLAAILLGLVSVLSRRRWLRLIIVGSLLWAYAVMVGLDQAPVVRATLMITVALVAPVVFRPASVANAIGVAAFLLLVISPSELFAPGFQLTFLAVASLGLVALPLLARLQAIGRWRPTEATPQPPNCPTWLRQLAETMYWDQRRFDQEMKTSPIKYRLDKASWARTLARWPGLQPIFRAVCLSLLVSTVVQMAMLPAMVVYFHRVAFGGILLNVVVSLLVVLLILSAFVTMAAAQISLSLAPPLVVITDKLAQWTQDSMMPVLQLHWASFRVAEYTGWASLVYGLYFVPLLVLAYALHRWQPFDGPSSRFRDAEARSRTSPGRATGTAVGRPEAGAAALETDSATDSQAGGRPLWKLIRRALQSAPLRIMVSRYRFSHLSRRLAFVAGPACVLLFLSCFFIITVHPGGIIHRAGWLTISFLDVDQGDAALVQFPGGTTMLIDSGGRPQLRPPSSERDQPGFVEDTLTVGEAVVSNFLWARGLEQLDYLLPTHADIDHIQGFTDILNNFRVGRALVARTPTEDPEFTQFERARVRARVPVQGVAAGDRFRIEGVTMAILWPPRTPDRVVLWDNDESVVMKMTYGRRTFLWTGDITQTVERRLIALGLDLQSDVVKVPHHGSRSSSTEDFIRHVRPRYAVISVGEQSPFGHPHPEIIERYRSLGVEILQTGRQGTITISTDGERVEVSTFVR